MRRTTDAGQLRRESPLSADAVYQSALDELRELLNGSVDREATLEKALGIVARAFPSELLALVRLRLDSGETDSFAAHGRLASRTGAATLPMELGSWISRQRESKAGVQAGRCRFLSSTAAALPLGLDADIPVHLLVLSRRGGWSDVLVLARRHPIDRKNGARELLCSLLVLVQLFLDRESGWRQGSRLNDQIERAKREWEASVDALPQLVCLVNADGIVVRSNRAIETLGLGDVRTAAGTDFMELLERLGVLDAACDATPDTPGPAEPAPRTDDPSAEPRLRLWEQWRAAPGGGAFTLGPLASPDGRVFELRIRRSGLPGECGGEIPYQVAVLDDVTERQRARHLLEHFNEQLRREVETKTAALRRTNRRLQLEVDAHRRDTEALRLSEHMYHSFVEKTRTGIYLAEGGRLTYCNKRFASMLGYEEEDLLGKRIVSVLGKHYARSATVPSDTADPHSGRECLIYGKNGRRIWLDITEAPYADGERDIIVANVLDITARKDFEDRLVASKRRTDQLSEQLLIAQERERARISRELHDGVGQRINAIKLMLDNVVSECKQDSDSKYRDALVELGGSLRETVEEVRRVSMALRPSILDDLGIAATLTWFVREFKRAVPGMEIECDLSLDESNMEPLLKTELFRITQEAFNNIAKHAGACRIRFSLVAGDGALVLRIEDDGQGILSVQEPGEHGVGLHSMQERAELTGGDLFVVTRDGAGTTVIGVWRSR